MEERRMFTIEQARKYAGMTQEEMAKNIGISRSAYIRIENAFRNAPASQFQILFCNKILL